MVKRRYIILPLVLSVIGLGVVALRDDEQAVVAAQYQTHSYWSPDSPKDAVDNDSVLVFEAQVISVDKNVHTSPNGLRWTPIVVKVVEQHKGALERESQLTLRSLSQEQGDGPEWKPETFQLRNKLMIFSQPIVDVAGEGFPAATPNYVYVLANGRAQSARKGPEQSESEDQFRERVNARHG